MAVDTEQHILETARKHFVRNGFAGARMQEIADEAGINKAMLHYYFRTKQQLYERITGHVLDQLLPGFAGAIDAEGTVLAKIERMVHVYVSTLTAHPDIPLFIISELSQKRENLAIELQKRAHYFPVLRQFFLQMSQEMEAGKIRKIEPIHLLLNIVGMCVFPFIAKPIFHHIIGVPEAAFDALMKQRAAVIVEFVRQALRVD
jgi:AcrR family transcriptional regulator